MMERRIYPQYHRGTNRMREAQQSSRQGMLISQYGLVAPLYAGDAQS